MSPNQPIPYLIPSRVSPEYRKKKVALTFEQGLNSYLPDSMLTESSYSVVLENLVPEQAGNLRCRLGWLNCSATGAPGAPRKGKGLGLFSSFVGYATPVRVQHVVANTATPAWGGATVAGNLLILVVTKTSAGTAPTVPAGWVSAKSSVNGANVRTDIYYIENAASRSGTETITGAGTYRTYLLEYSGFGINTLDQTASNTGTSTAPDTGTTATTAQTAEVWLGAVASNINAAMNTPTNGFTLLDNGINTLTSGLLEKIVTATGTANSGVTTTSAAWAGAMVTFKVKVLSTTTNYLMAAHDGATQYGIYALDRSNLSGGTWTNVENVATSATSGPVDFALGLQNVFYSSPNFGNLRRWDGTTAAAVSAAPAGRCVTFHKNRLFLGGTLVNPTRVWYSNLGDYTTWPATNYFDVSLDDAEPIEDMAEFEDGLLIGKASSLWFLSGAGADTFSLSQLPGGGAAPGRSLCPTPYGAVIADTAAVYLWTGGGIETISKPLGGLYTIASGNYVSTAYADGVCYITDGAGVTFAFNLVEGSWRIEKCDTTVEAPIALLCQDASEVFAQPAQGTVFSLACHRVFPGGARQKDPDTLAETFKVQTPSYWFSETVGPITPRHLDLRLRQLGGTTGDTGLTVTPIYNGTNQAAQTVPVISAAGVFRARVDLPLPTTGDLYGIAFLFSQTMPSGKASLIEVERAWLEYEEDPPR